MQLEPVLVTTVVVLEPWGGSEDASHLPETEIMQDNGVWRSTRLPVPQRKR